MTQNWTFETLAQASKSSLENIFLNGTAPDIEQLNGNIYCGWNHEPIGKLTGEKFKKGFCKKEGINYGYNEPVKQDRKKYMGEWISGIANKSQPTQMGYFRVAYAKDEDILQSYMPYRHLAVFNYKVPQPKWYQGFFRVIRDFIVLPNEGDHSLLLGKAYVQLPGSIKIFCCYFLLGHPQKIQYTPW